MTRPQAGVVRAPDTRRAPGPGHSGRAVIAAGPHTGPRRLLICVSADQRPSSCSPGWTRTNNPPINSRMLCQLSYRGSLVQRGANISKAPARSGNQGSPTSWSRQLRALRGPPQRRRVGRGPRPRRTRRPTRLPPPPGARRAMTRRPRRPATATCRWSTTLAVTRSRTSSSRRPGSARVAGVDGSLLAPAADLGEPEGLGVAVPVGGLDLLPRHPAGLAVDDDVERVAGAGRGRCRRPPSRTPAPSPPRATATCGVDRTSEPHD